LWLIPEDADKTAQAMNNVVEHEVCWTQASCIERCTDA
jgi:hypothetical protein